MSKKVKVDKKLLWIKTKKDLDVIRGACDFGTNQKELLAVKKNSKGVLCLLGEDFEDISIVYYATNSCEGMEIEYMANGEGEKIDCTKSQIRQPGINYINILPIKMLPFGEAKKIDAITINVEDKDSLIKSIIKKGVENEEIEKIYIFEKGGKIFAGAFSVLEELMNSKKIFYYTELANYNESAFIRYNYQDNTTEFTNEFGEHSYLYIKIINLAEPFPFFKEG
ncbi:MAG: hypothetical protein ACP5RT_02800 [Candidatus Micrarchaeia archaeon]